jgi:hypothetical protein
VHSRHILRCITRVFFHDVRICTSKLVNSGTTTGFLHIHSKMLRHRCQSSRFPEAGSISRWCFGPDSAFITTGWCLCVFTSQMTVLYRFQGQVISVVEMLLAAASLLCVHLLLFSETFLSLRVGRKLDCSPVGPVHFAGLIQKLEYC